MSKFIRTILFVGIFLGGTGIFCFAQETAQSDDAKAIERAVEKAIKKVNQDKAQEDAALIASLEGKLLQATEEWISQQKSKKYSELNKEVEQDWEFLSKYGPRVHYRYYLRDYDYSEGGRDIIDTDSVLVPYKGYSIVTELLFVEKEHPAAASDMKLFYFTASTPIKVNFDYKMDRFVFTNAEKEDISLNQGWPPAVMIRLKAK